METLIGTGSVNMLERWIGVVVASDRVTAVDAEVPDSGPLVILADHSWPLQKGDRALAYRVLHQQVADYCKEHEIKRAIIKGSAVSLGGTKKVHLEAAELRGVVISACATVANTDMVAKATISRTFGKRKVDDYIGDNNFWTQEVVGVALRIGSREAAMVLLAARDAK
jgi:hypothetical protein